MPLVPFQFVFDGCEHHFAHAAPAGTGMAAQALVQSGGS